jgi:CRP/FNR family transcriptional regulator, cyclic AMP receptor protein
MKKKLLLIEDNTDIRETTAEVLEAAGYTVLTESNGKSGYETALKERPDLIICDIMMPVIDGYGVLHLLSKHDEMSGIPFIFLTAKSERSDQRRGMALGADDYITKPFDVIDLLSAIETRIKKADLAKKEYANSAEGVGEFLGNVNSVEALTTSLFGKEITRHSKKELLYRQGSYPKGVYFINRGVIKTFKTNDHGKEFITGVYRTGDFLGYTALIEEGPHHEAAMVLEDSEVSMIPKADFLSLVYKNAQISRRFLKMMSNSLLDRERQLINLAYNSVRKRVAEALIKLSDPSPDEVHVIRSASRENLANIAGAALETTVRTLSDFRQEGLIEMTPNRIIILKFDQLSTLRN